MASIFFISGEEISLRIVTYDKTIDIFKGPLFDEDDGYNWQAEKVGSLTFDKKDLRSLIARLELMSDD